MASLYDQIVNGKSGNDSQPTFYKQITGEDYNVAPIKTTTKKKKKSGWFDTGAFDDGYDIGDITKTILSTGGDIVTNVTKGIFSIGEGIGDLINYGIAGISEATGHKDFAEGLREETKKSLADEIFGTAEEFYDKNSLVGEKSDKLVQTAGTIYGNVATGSVGMAKGLGARGVTALTTGMSGLSTSGRSMGEAYRNGATNEQASLYGLISGTSSALVNLIVGGYGNSVNATGLSSGIGRLDDKVATVLTQKISNQLARNFAEMGIKSVGEGLEKVMTGVIDAFGKKITYMSDEDIDKLIKDEDLLGQFIQGSITSAVMQTPSVARTFVNKEKLYAYDSEGNRIKDKHGKEIYKTKYSLRNKEAVRDYVSGLTKNEQKVYDKEVEKRISAIEEGGTKATAKQKRQIKNETKKDLMSGYVSTDTIEEALGEEQYKQIKELTERKKTIQDEIDSINKKIKGDFDKSAEEGIDNFDELGKFAKENANDKKRIKELKEQLESIDRTINRTKQSVSEQAEMDSQKDDFLRESYNEKARRKEVYQANLDDYTPKQQKLIQKAMDSGMLNNTRKTHEYMDMLAKISEEKGLDFDFINNKSIKENQDILLDNDSTINGYNKNGKISLNIDSQKSLNTVVGHEVTHAFEDTDEYANLQKAVKEYAETKGDYQKVYDKMSKLYKNVEGANIDNEVTSELIGDYLFTDKEFINKLSIEDKTSFQKAFDEVKYLSKVATAGSKEKRQFEKIKKDFQEIYKQNIADTSEEVAPQPQTKENSPVDVEEVKAPKKAVKTENIEPKKEDIAPVKTQTSDEVDPYEDFGNNVEKYMAEFENENGKNKYSLANKNKNKYNNSTLFTQMMQKVKPDYEGRLVLNDSKNYYLVNKDSNNNFEVLDKIEINDSNKNFIDEMIKEWDYDSRRKSDNDIIEKSQLGQRYSNSDSSYDEENETWFEYAGRILEGDKSKNNNPKRNITEGSSNSETGELDNSSFFDEKAPVRKTNNLNEYIEDVSTREAQQLANDRTSAKQIINDYLDENNIKNPTMKDINNAFDDYEEFDSAGWGTDESKRARKIFDDVAKEVYNERNQTNGTKYSVSKVMPTQDNKGNKLSKNQQKYFKDSQVTDESGNLLKVYHGTRNDFTVFDKNKSGQSNSTESKAGFWFTESENGAKNFGDSVWYGDNEQAKAMEVYLNIKKPKVYEEANYDNEINNVKQQQQEVNSQLKKIYDKYDFSFDIFTGRPEQNTFETISRYSDAPESEIKKAIKDWAKANDVEDYYNDIKTYQKLNKEAKQLENSISDFRYTDAYEQFRNDIYKVAGKSPTDANLGGTGMALNNSDEVMAQYISNLKKQGYDGIIIKGTNYDSDRFGNNNNQYVAFYPEQIKNADNLNPTDNPDIRYSKGNDKAPVGKYNVYGEDIKIEDKAPAKNELGYTPKDPTQESSYDFDNGYKKKNDPVEEMLRTELRRKDEQRIAKEEANKKQEVKLEKTPGRKIKDTLMRMFVNSNQELDNLAKESGNQNVKYKADMLNNVYAEAQNDINNAQTNNNGEAIGKSVKQLFSDAKNQGLNDAFNDYLIHYSNIDRHKFEKGSVVPLEMSKQVVKDYENLYPQFKEWGKDVWNYGKNIRESQLDAGIITKELADKLGEMYPHYVPYMDERDLSQYIGTDGEIKPVTTIKRGKGGADSLLPVEEALTRYTYSNKKAVRQNQLYSEVVNTLYDEKNPINIFADNTDPANIQGNLYRDEKGSYLTAFIDGKEKSARISDDLYKTLNRDMENQVKNLEKDLSALTTPLQKVSKVRRNILTSWNPTFIVKNAVKDVQDAGFNSKYTKDFVKNYPTAYKELLDSKNPLANQFKALYGSGNLMGEYDVDSGLYTGTSKNSKFLKRIASANDVVELAPRYAEFKSSIENGASVQEAMYNAREVTTNFSRGGVITKAMNRNGFTFLNASVQGLDKFARNLSGENGARGVASSLIKATTMGVAPAIFNELAFGSGEDKDKDYEALPDYIKDNYYVIKSGKGSFIRIPKGRALSVFGSLARRTLEYSDGDKDAFKGYLQNVNSQIGVSNPEENNIFAPFIQAYGSENGNAWYGGDLVPTRLQNKPKAEQYDETTDEFSKWLGEKLNISPYKLNYVIDQYSGGVGDILLPTITKEASSDNDSVLGTALAPVKDQFIVNSTTDNKYVSEFYDTNDKLTVKANSYKATDDDLLKKKYMSSMSSELSKLYAERREVQNDETMSRSERFKKSQNIKNEINRISKEALDSYNNLEKYDNYATVGESEYYKNNKGSWSKINEKESDYLNSLGLTSREKDSYFNTSNQIYQIKNDYKDRIANATDEEKTNLNVQKKTNIINSIKNSGLTNEAKAYLYDKSYGDTDVLNALTDLNVNMNAYLDLEAQNFTYDKYVNGKSVPNSKKRKVFNYINSMNIPYEQKLILAKLKYASYNDNNYEIIRYLDNSPLDYNSKIQLFKKMGFKVSADGKVSWK